jgi:hypothetical protein
MARPEALIPGNCYFMVGFHDRELLFPDGGRTRILSFPAPEKLEILLGLCGDVLMEIYAMRADDSLNYTFLKASDVRPAGSSK